MKTVFRQSILVLSLTTLGLSLSYILPVFYFMDGLYYETNMRGLRNTARILLASLPPEQLQACFENPGGGEAVPPWLRRFPPESPYRITLIGTGGGVAADSRLIPGELENHGERPEVRQALEGREGTARRKSSSLGTELLYAALPFYKPAGAGQISGVFRLAEEVPNFRCRISSAALPFLALGGALFFLALFLVFLFSRSLSRSFIRLANIAQSVKSPEFFDLINSPHLMSDTEECITLERALKAMGLELNLRIINAYRERRRLEAILNGMSEGVFALDKKGKIRMVNRRGRELFGLGQEIKAGDLSLLEAAHSVELEEIAREVLSGGAPREREISWHGAGFSRRFHVFAAPLNLGPAGDEPQTPEAQEAQAGGQGVVMVLGDITRLHKLEQVRKDFAANVSHELRTPIQIIKGFAETLLDSPLDNRKQIRHCIGLIEKNALAMENLTNDLLSLVSLEDERGFRPEMRETKIQALFDEAVQVVKAGAKKKDISIHVRCPPDLSAPLSGPLIIQALVNLLDNGIKYSPPNSKIFLEAQAGPEELLFYVRDQGIGISPEHLGRIFERFYRVDRSRSQDPGGTGLGLAIVRHIALLHQGQAEVESHAGEGSVFKIRIPRRP